MFSIEVYREDKLIAVRLTGLLSADEVAAYIAEVKRQFVLNRLRDYCMVIDVSDCPLQSQEMLRSMGAHMATMPKAYALAIVTGDSIARGQVRRLFTQPYARITATVEEGRAWVLSGAEPLAA